MSFIVPLLALSFGMQAYGAYASGEAAKDSAKLQKEDIALKEESLKLSEQARKLQEDLAESKVRVDARRARAHMITKAAISGASYSSSDVAMGESLSSQVESGIAREKELSGIKTQMSSIEERRLSAAASSISTSKDIDLNTILGITGSAIGTGVSLYATGAFDRPKYTTDYSIPVNTILDTNYDLSAPAGVPVGSSGYGGMA